MRFSVILRLDGKYKTTEFYRKYALSKANFVNTRQGIKI